MLLTSDINGYVEDPGYYFLQDDDATNIAIDDLLLTNGWRRFKWEEVLNNTKPYTVKFPAKTNSGLKNPSIALPVNINGGIKNPFIIPGLKKMHIDPGMTKGFFTGVLIINGKSISLFVKVI